MTTDIFNPHPIQTLNIVCFDREIVKMIKCINALTLAYGFYEEHSVKCFDLPVTFICCVFRVDGKYFCLQTSQMI